VAGETSGENDVQKSRCPSMMKCSSAFIAYVQWKEPEANKLGNASTMARRLMESAGLLGAAGKSFISKPIGILRLDTKSEIQFHFEYRIPKTLGMGGIPLNGSQGVRDRLVEVFSSAVGLSSARFDEPRTDALFKLLIFKLNWLLR
jgi:hypothetical protein